MQKIDIFQYQDIFKLQNISIKEITLKTPIYDNQATYKGFSISRNMKFWGSTFQYKYNASHVSNFTFFNSHIKSKK